MDKRLQQLRETVEQIDYKIISLLAERQKLAPQFAVVKKKLGLALHQQRRERELLKKYRLVAVKKKVAVSLIEKIFSLLFKASLREQRRVFEKERLK